MKNVNIVEMSSVMNAMNFASETAEIMHLSTHDDQPYQSWIGANVYKVEGPEKAIVTATIVLMDTTGRKTSMCQSFRVNGPVTQTIRTVSLINNAKQ